MNASLAPSDVLPLRMAEDAGIEQWLEALDASECTAEEFLNVVLDHAHDDPEVTWEALSLLDQHFRRKLIRPETYAALKAGLQQHSLGLRRVRRDADAVTRVPAIAARPASPAAHVEASSPQSLRVGDLLSGRYRVVDLLHRDAAGTLVEAIDEPKAAMPGIRQRLAIQVMDHANSCTPELMQRIGRLQALSHPGIPRIFDVEQDRGSLLLTMELLKGVTLRELLERGRAQLGTGSALAILRSVASALTYAHANGVTHGNVGVPNVFVTDHGEVRLRGFGLLGASAGDPAADGRAFASLAYDLLADADDAGRGAYAPGSRLRQPAGITRGRWRWLRSALQGKDDAAAMLLAAFANDAGAPAGRVSALEAFERPAGRRKGVREWLATGMLLLLVIVVGFFYLTSRSQQTQQVAQAAIPAAPLERQAVAPPAQVPREDKAASPGADSPVAEAVSANASAMAEPRIDLLNDTAWVETTEPVARIWVRRRGSLGEAVTFQWWTESGSALPDRDFRAVAPRTEVIRKGAGGVEVLVPLIPDASRGEARTFFVKIDAAGSGVALGSRTLMQVAIVPPGYPAAR